MFLSLPLRKATLGLILAAAATALFSLSAQAGDPLVGTWELNLEKSKFSPTPPPISRTVTYEMTDQQEKMIAKIVDAKGNLMVRQFSASRDGKDYPYEGWPIVDTISMTPVEPFTVNYTLKKAGEIVVTGIREVSKDGKILTVSSKITNAQGQKVDILEVYDKR
jgi:hypothetical protein